MRANVMLALFSGMKRLSRTWHPMAKTPLIAGVSKVRRLQSKNYETELLIDAC